MKMLFYSHWWQLVFPLLALIFLLWTRRGRYLQRWEALTVAGLLVLVVLRAAQPEMTSFSLQPLWAIAILFLLILVFFLEKGRRRQHQLVKELRAWATYSLPQSNIFNAPQEEPKDILFLLDDHNAEIFLPHLPTTIGAFSCQILVISHQENPNLIELAQSKGATILFHSLGSHGHDSYGLGYAAANFLECPFGLVLGDGLPEAGGLENGILQLIESKTDLVVARRPLKEQAKMLRGGKISAIVNNALCSFLTGQDIRDASSSTFFFKSRQMMQLDLVEAMPQSQEIRLLVAQAGLKQCELPTPFLKFIPPQTCRPLLSNIQRVLEIWWRQ